MNQILSTKLKNKKKANSKFFKYQFSISILILLILIGCIFYSFLCLQKKEKLSDNLLGNYNIYKLYANVSQEISEEKEEENNLFGTIEIPKLNLYYPVFSHLNEELLKISPCKFYGNSPKENGNIGIAGHNYNNSMFFSNLTLLTNGDEIYLQDSFGNSYVYIVFKVYEVKASDLSPIFDAPQFSKELTLVTCNNLNGNRFILKANQI